MSVQQQLGLEEDSLLVQEIRERWSVWSGRDERLAAVVEFDGFRAWLRSAGVQDTDDALCALAWLAAHDGGDDVIAGAALAWALLPGAATLAARLARFSTRIDDLVAAQLWIEVRSFPWRRRRRVAANVLLAARAGVLHDLGERLQIMRTDRSWARADLVGGFEGIHFETVHAQPGLGAGLFDQPSGEQEMRDVLAWGVEEGLISGMDRRVLTELVDEAWVAPPTRARTCNGGLSGRELTHRVAPRLGVSPATVRRRVKNSVAALAAASDRYVA